MRFDAATVDDHLASLPDERREALEEVLTVILAELPGHGEDHAPGKGR